MEKITSMFLYNPKFHLEIKVLLNLPKVIFGKILNFLLEPSPHNPKSIEHHYMIERIRIEHSSKCRNIF